MRSHPATEPLREVHKRRIRVLIIDDSAIVRKLLTEILSGSPDIEVVGAAPDPCAARERIAASRPDVITLDIEMPRMDGLTFLRSYGAEMGIPVIVVSSVAKEGCAAALQALEAGAVEVVAKPGGPYSVADLRTILPMKIRAASHAKRVPGAHGQAVSSGHRSVVRVAGTAATPPIIALGASTGGTEALRSVLATMPASTPPIVIVQHIPPVVSRAFADRLNSLCRIHVMEAEHGQRVEAGTALVAPGDRHMSVYRLGGVLKVALTDSPPVCHQRPSVDVLFRSVASACGSNAVGVILTGMGADGAAGLLKMKEAGAVTMAQDESTCVVYGMPREAVRLGAAQNVLPLPNIARAICTAAGCHDLINSQ